METLILTDKTITVQSVSNKPHERERYVDSMAKKFPFPVIDKRQRKKQRRISNLKGNKRDACTSHDHYTASKENHQLRSLRSERIKISPNYLDQRTQHIKFTAVMTSCNNFRKH